MIDFESDDAIVYWTCSTLRQLDVHPWWNGQTQVFVPDPIPSHAIASDSISFDVPESWGDQFTIRLTKSDDGIYRYQD